jgi:hypothetical protein
VRWNLRFPRHLLETTHAWFMIITIISKNIAPPFVHKFSLLIVYKKLRILVIGTHYGLSVWCGYTLAKSENKQFSKLSYQFFWPFKKVWWRLFTTWLSYTYLLSSKLVELTGQRIVCILITYVHTLISLHNGCLHCNSFWAHFFQKGDVCSW